MDVLSDLLRAVRLTGAIYFDVRARAPWVAETPAMRTICAKVMPEFEHVIAFHIMLEGRCWAQLGDESEPPLRTNVGDVILLPRGDSHLMGSERGRRGEADLDKYYRPSDRRLPFVLTEVGGSGEKARFVCGYLGCDARPFNPLLDALPRLTHIHCFEEGSDLTFEFIRVALEESERTRSGSEIMLAKLSELMFLQALRKYIDSLPQDVGGWFSAFRDPHVGAALTLIHGRPAEPWTLDGLARKSGLSRSALSERFTQLVGEPPMRYLGRWRMQLAARALERPGGNVAQAAAEVGYQSEAAFNRAFKKYVGAPPGEWRRTHTPSIGGGAL